jgi:TatD DNase family protein
MWIDSHCHLTFPGLAEQTQPVLARAHAADVGRVITIGTNPADHPAALALAQTFGEVFLALGVHPHHAEEVGAAEMATLALQLTASTKIVGVGECGLDYHYDFAPKPRQREIWIAQLEFARRLNLPVILHIREAHVDALAVMKDYQDLRRVVHCFTGKPAECAAWIATGAYIGITGIVTYKNAGEVREDAKMVPEDRLLLETDSPYLSPEPVRKTKINEPAHVAHVGKFVAALRGVSPESLAQQTCRNAAALFGTQLLEAVSNT